MCERNTIQLVNKNNQIMRDARERKHKRAEKKIEKKKTSGNERTNKEEERKDRK